MPGQSRWRRGGYGQTSSGGGLSGCLTGGIGCVVIAVILAIAVVVIVIVLVAHHGSTPTSSLTPNPAATPTPLSS
jgi:uncharacterized membrane protein